MCAVPPIASVVGWPRLLSVKRTMFDSADGTDEGIAGLELTKSEYVADAESRVDTAVCNKFTAAIRREMESDDGPTVDFDDIDVPILVITGEEPASDHEETVTELLDRAPNAKVDSRISEGVGW